jgi:hypothetical protein
MIIRKGFVSNSSSTSFIVCLPEDMTFEKLTEGINWEEDYADFYEGNTNLMDADELKNGVKTCFDELMRDHELWLYGPYKSQLYHRLMSLLGDFVVGELSQDSTESTVYLINTEKTRAILEGRLL